MLEFTSCIVLKSCIYNPVPFLVISSCVLLRATFLPFYPSKFKYFGFSLQSKCFSRFFRCASVSTSSAVCFRYFRTSRTFAAISFASYTSASSPHVALYYNTPSLSLCLHLLLPCRPCFQDLPLLLTLMLLLLASSLLVLLPATAWML